MDSQYAGIIYSTSASASILKHHRVTAAAGVRAEQFLHFEAEWFGPDTRRSFDGLSVFALSLGGDKGE